MISGVDRNAGIPVGKFRGIAASLSARFGNPVTCRLESWRYQQLRGAPKEQEKREFLACNQYGVLYFECLPERRACGSSSRLRKE